MFTLEIDLPYQKQVRFTVLQRLKKTGPTKSRTPERP